MASTSGLGTKEISTRMQKLLSFVPHSAQLSIRFLGVMPFDLFPLPTFTASIISDSLLSSASPIVHSLNAISCIVNTDPSSRPGQHWVAFFLAPHGKLEFFDSYGRPPTHFGFPLNSQMLEPACFEYNTLSLQADSTSVCGQYCLVFLFLRCLIAVHTNLQELNMPALHFSLSANTPLKTITTCLFSLAPTARARDREINVLLQKLLSLLKPCHSSSTRYQLSPNHTAFEQRCSSAFNYSSDS